MTSVTRDIVDIKEATHIIIDEKLKCHKMLTQLVIKSTSGINIQNLYKCNIIITYHEHTKHIHIIIINIIG